MKINGAKKTAGFPHLTQRGNACGKRFSAWYFACSLLLVTGWAQAQTAAQQIDSTARAYLQQMMNKHAQENSWQGMRLVIDSKPLTNTQSLTPCPHNITTTGGSTTKLSRQQLTLECSGNKGWPVKVSADLQVLLPVVISTGVIDRGATITATSLKREDMDIAKTIRGFYHRTDEVTGMSAKRRIRANQVLSPDLIDQPQLVKRGEKVQIVANHDGIKAAMAGEALEKGGVGDVIRVKNISSGKTIESKVVEVGVVTSTF